jgi:hypothetical protein
VDIAYYQNLLAGTWRGINDALCLTYVQGINEDTTIRAFGGDPASASMRSLPQVAEELSRCHYSEIPYLVLVKPFGDWLIGLEPNGFQGSRPEVLRAASTAGTAVSVYWNVNHTNRFAYATKGQTQLGFDMHRPTDRHGANQNVLDAQLNGLPFGAGNSWAAGLTLAERVTGVRLPADLLDGEFRRAELRPVPQDLVHEGMEADPALEDPFIRRMLAAPTADKLPEITRYIAEVVAQSNGIADLSPVRAALDALAGDERPKPPLRDQVLALAKRYESEARAGRETLDRVHAARAIAAALNPDPAMASAEMLSWAGYCVRDHDDRVRLTVLGRCRDRAVADQ